ncbi:hypothetical protein [Deinococcus pimensis]|uniref:hypothetical protein n=1 Tax=Deinococcus pimensis TaxID=309888 RepID=UPI0004898156|nr:hypothetical protein [Deinococcus pimensis]
MTITVWDRQEWREARDTIAGLLTDDRTSELDLFQAARLTPRLFERVMLDLLHEGRAQRYASTPGGVSYARPRQAGRGGAPKATRLCRDELAVHAFLEVAPNTARKIADTLGMRLTEVHRVLDQLARLDLVTFRYVGQLNIYRATWA